MIGEHARVPVYAYGRPVDMRKSFESLAALVRAVPGHDPLSGALYLFTNRRRGAAKVLSFDGSGLCIYHKRLERGRFAALWNLGDDGPLRLTRAELELFLHGSQLVGRIDLMPVAMSENDLAFRTGS
jgi:transposase